MKRDLSAWIGLTVAAGVLVVIAAQTFGALRVAGAWGWGARAPRTAPAPAYQSLDRAIGRSDTALALAGLRDPFAEAPRDLPSPRVASRPAHPAPIPVPASPVLTAIVWDSDPRALVHWKEREWTVRDGGLFDEFQVRGITRDQVTLVRGDETLVLKRYNHGD